MNETCFLARFCGKDRYFEGLGTIDIAGWTV